MISKLAELAHIVSGTPLEGREALTLPVLDTDELAFAVSIDPTGVDDAWRVARGLVERTGRWPVVVSCFGADVGSWADQLAEQDLFSRFFYEDHADGGDVSPRALLAAADHVDVDAYIEQLASERAARDDLDEYAGYALEETRKQCGSAPTFEDCYAARVDGRPLGSAHELERFLLDWEEAHGRRGDPSNARPEWFEPEDATLLFLPTPHSWDALAYLHWYGSSPHGAHHDIALGRRWLARDGAELAMHYGTMLGAFVSRPPKSVDAAWRMAREHDLVAPCTLLLPGTPLRRYALALLGCERWFLHERP
ncbi:MAG: DUF4253 domain-containing protein [Planctomycetes bacterium]|nr:DUF4253 domain-containing protein [Planctomycetota bacterium]